MPSGPPLDETMSLPTLEEFTEATLDVLARTPLFEYAPTFVFENEMIGLEAIPEDMAHTDALQDHAGRSGWHDVEFLFGVRSGESVVTIGHYDSGRVSCVEIRCDGDVPVAAPVDRPAWWRFEP